MLADCQAMLSIPPNQSTEDRYNLFRQTRVSVGPPRCACANVVSFDLGTLGHTQKKTSVFDRRHVRLIDRSAQDHQLDRKDGL
jgi:hypothetical protein